MRIAVVDYEAGNLRSVANALRKLKAEPVITKSARELAKCDGIIIPGVGSFGRVRQLAKMRKEIIRLALEGRKPLLGICLGMQLLFEGSEEAREKGLGIFQGKLTRIRARKVPLIGWSNLKITNRKSRLLKGMGAKDYFYFVHSYAVKRSGAEAARCDYGDGFVAVVEKGNIFGAQFHPEKSGESGLLILKNFLALCKG